MLSDYQRAFNHPSLFPNNSFIENVYSECLSAPATRYVYEISVVRSGVENNLCHLRQGWEAALEASCKGNQHRDTTSNFGHCERRIAMSNLSQWLQTKTKLDRNINMTNEFHIYDGHLTFASFAKIWNVSKMSVWHKVGQMSEVTYSVPISPSSHNRIVITERHIDNQYQKHQRME